MKLGTVALVGVAMAIMLTTVSSSPFLGFHKPLPSSDTVPDIPLRPYCEPLFNIRRPKLRAKLRSVYLSLKLKLGFSGMSASYDAAYKLLLKAFRNGYKGVGGEHLADAPSKEQGHVSFALTRTPNGIRPRVAQDTFDAGVFRSVTKMAGEKPEKYLILDRRIPGHQVAMALIGHCYKALADTEKMGDIFATYKKMQ
ncbi:hypothetical protein H4R33_002985 [Dimargaris cristalligena]|nr:hypothetical protein H4R33_002985 [Dimargaris cristalligena]